MTRRHSGTGKDSRRREKIRIQPAVQYIKPKIRIKPIVGIVLGSGLGGFGEKLNFVQAIPYQDIPGFPLPTVPGHSGRLLMGYLKERPVAVLQGRCHLYEGHTAAQVAFPVRVLVDLGVRILIVTSSAGAVSQKLYPGDVMLIRDHLNLMGDNPLRARLPLPVRQAGARQALGDRDRSIFVDLVGAYDAELIEIASKAALEVGIQCQRGVLAGVSGPSYETPAEVAMLRTLGADAVCMSTLPEVIMARYLNLRVLGMLLITNRAADASSLGINAGGMKRFGHQQVLEMAMGKIDQVSAILERVVEAVGV